MCLQSQMEGLTIQWVKAAVEVDHWREMVVRLGGGVRHIYGKKKNLFIR